MGTQAWDGVERRLRTTARWDGFERRSTWRALVQQFTRTDHPFGLALCLTLGHPNALEEVPPSQRSKKARELGHVWFRCPRCKAPNGRVGY